MEKEKLTVNGQVQSVDIKIKFLLMILQLALKGQQEMATKVDGGSLLLPVPFYIFDL